MAWLALGLQSVAMSAGCGGEALPALQCADGEAWHQWTRNSTTKAVGVEEVLFAGMQLRGDALRTSFNPIVASRYSLNRKQLLLPVLSTDRLNTLGWILSLTSTVQSRMWMFPVLILSLAVRPWCLQPAQNQDLWPQERKRTNLTDIHTSNSFLSSSRPQIGFTHMPTCQEIHSLPHARCR